MPVVWCRYLVRAQPEGPWSGQKVLELGCGTGQLGIVLALAGAAVTLTDLAHIVPLTQTNVDLNASRCSIQSVCVPYMWGSPVADIPMAPAQQQQQHGVQQQEGEQQQKDEQQQAELQGEQPQTKSCACLQQQQGQQQQQQGQGWDVLVAADVLYEPQYYDILINSLLQLCPSPSKQQQQQQQGAQEQQEQQQQWVEPPAARPPPPVYICYCVRRYAESSFETKAAAAGFSVCAVPVDELHKDYQCGGYRLIRLTRE